MNRIKGILYAAVSSSTFGLAPFFSITLLLAGFSAFEVLSYRWGVASIVLIVFGWLSGCNFRLAGKDWGVVFLFSLLRAVTSFSLIIAYQNIASGVASTIHFMYPLAVALAMMFFFREKKSLLVILAVLMSLLGALYFHWESWRRKVEIQWLVWLLPVFLFFHTQGILLECGQREPYK